MFEEVATVDNGFYARQWGLRRSRSMDLRSKTAPSTYTRILNGNTSTPSYHTTAMPPTPYGGYKYTVDCNNLPWIRLKQNLGSNAPFFVDTGGPFYSETIQVDRPQYVDKHFGAKTASSQAIVKGYFYPSYDSISYYDRVSDRSLGFGPVTTDDATLRGWGATGISRTIPTQPEMSLSTSIAELKDGLPSIVGQQMLRDRDLFGASGEYLNYQFGISPLISDVEAVLSLTKRYEKILKQFRRDKERIVRRKITLDESTKVVNRVETVKTTYAISGTSQPLQTLYADRYHMTVDTKQRIWFSAGYALAYPGDLDDLLSQIIEFNRVYGVIPTPELAWELLPFSFLVDWFTNVGDVIKNVSYLGPATSLAYAYIMGEYEFTNKMHGLYGPDYYWTRDPKEYIELSNTLRRVRKRRIKASPFGFTTDFSSLTEKQKSILTALGISRLRL